jgi:hypothetical protein
MNPLIGEDDNIINVRKKPIKKKSTLEIPPHVENIDDLIQMAYSGKKYANINTEMLWRISAQLVELNDMIGMFELKQSIFYHIIYYLQNLFIDDEKDYLHTVIMGPPGSGKCLGKNTLIMLFNGDYIKVQYVKVGDILMGDDSTPRHVLSICNGIDKLYKVIQPNNSYIVNKDHIISLIDESYNKIDIPLLEYLEKSQLWKKQYYGYKVPVYFNIKEEFIIDPYIFGYCLFSNYTMYKYDNIIDPNHEEYNMSNLFIDICGSEINTYDYLKSFDVLKPYNMSTSNNVIWPDRTTYFLNKDYFGKYYIYLQNKQFPSEYKYFSHDILINILLGIIDAIGVTNIEHNIRSSHLYLDNKELFICIQTICNITNIDYNIHQKNYNIDISIISNNSICNKTLLTNYSLTIKNMFSKFSTNSSESRIGLYNVRSMQEDRYVKYPIDINYISTGEYFGFEIDGNGRFLLEDCTVTHNTTIAKIIGEMYKNMGILSPDGIFKIAKREDLVAEYLGQTAVKTKKLLESCIGGVLFIDEVYSLGPGKKDNDSFSKEAIDTLNAFLSENSDTFCCIVAGYEDEIKNCFFSVNQGLERRFQWIHRIGEYSIEDLGQMFIKILHDIKWKRDENLTNSIITRVIKENKNMFNSFGGDIENLITKCKMAHAKRIINMENPRKHYISEEDLLLAINLMKPNKLSKKDEIDSYLWGMYM